MFARREGARNLLPLLYQEVEIRRWIERLGFSEPNQTMANGVAVDIQELLHSLHVSKCARIEKAL